MRSITSLATLMVAIIFGGAAASLVSAAQPNDACSLLTQAQVSAVLGVSVGAGVPSGPSLCQWSQPGDTSSRGKRVLLNLFGPMGRLTPADRYATAKTPVKRITKTPVSGIGEEAFYLTRPTDTELTVKKGSSVFRISVYGYSPDQTKTMGKALALDALSKL
jgi:hypothetical protein